MPTKLLSRSHQLQLESLKNGLDENERLATEILVRLHNHIQSWNGISDVSEFNTYWTDNDANAVSAQGLAVTFKKDFHKFLEDRLTKEKLHQLLMLRKSNKIDFSIINNIVDVGLIKHLENFSFDNGRPFFYVHRLEIMLFPELFTSIADRTKLDKTAKLLGIKGKGVAFERLQYQIRDKVNDFIREEGLTEESDFAKRNLAWWIVEAKDVII